MSNRSSQGVEKPLIIPPRPSRKNVVRLLQKFPLHPDVKQYDYGTAGFRMHAEYLPPLMIRVGIIIALRALQTQEHVGVMVTASHNDESYNGIKFADPHGGMVGPEQEEIAHILANERDVKKLLNLIHELFVKYTQKNSQKSSSISGKNQNHAQRSSSSSAMVHIGRDTRSHSPYLSDLIVRTIGSMGVTVKHHGVVTTPMLHHCVLHANPQYLPLMIPLRPNRTGYMELLAHAYWGLIQTLNNESATTTTLDPLIVDCACGVGYSAIVQLNEAIQRVSCGSSHRRQLLARNGPGEGPLNDGCGSEAVQKKIQPPNWYSEDANSTTPSYAASLDGDADRIVFFSSTDGNFQMMDGDKISVLVCEFLQAQLDELYAQNPTLPKLTLGVVQTAYGNGASTQYMQNRMGSNNVLIAKTGVKHVHSAAHQFDIGVYFEANGHGTVLFSDRVQDVLLQCRLVDRKSNAWQRLRLLPCLINPAVGDALSDLLLVDFILQAKGWGISEWNTNLYQDLPSRQLKVQVKDRTMIKTNDNETRCLEPAALQAALDGVMRKVNGRCFVRPSGTENVVRVYAEAPSREDADWLAIETAKLVHKHCYGVGTLPSLPSKL